jgi:hypothetical protein
MYVLGCEMGCGQGMHECTNFEGTEHFSWNWAHDGMVRGVGRETWQGVIATKLITNILARELRSMTESHEA